MDFGIIEKLTKCIVRPPRSNYSIEQMGLPSFQLRNRSYERKDFTVLNNRGYLLQCSIFKDKYAPIARETIVFLHANSSSRLAIRNYIDIFLPYFDIVGFDFAGCGQSEGEYVTLGYTEKEDVYSVVSKVRQRYGVKDVILWGRSMGAATAILFAAKYTGVKAVISDNSFSDLQKLVNQLSNDYIPLLPSFLVDTILDNIQQYIEQNIWPKQTINFNIRKLKPILMIEKVKCPIFFIGSLGDTFVNVEHTKQLFKKTKAFKKIQLVKGDHNDLRNLSLKQKILHFLINLNSKTQERDNRPRNNIFKSHSEKFSDFEINNSPPKQILKKSLHLQITNTKDQNRLSCQKTNRQSLPNVISIDDNRQIFVHKRRKIFQGLPKKYT